MIKWQPVAKPDLPYLFFRMAGEKHENNYALSAFSGGHG
jgi:hypothetical protein